MAEININVYPDFVKLANVMWIEGAQQVPKYARTSGLFREMSIPNFTGNVREISEVELEQYASNKGESENARRAKTTQGYTKTIKSKRIGSEITISWEARNQGKYADIRQKLTNLGSLAESRMDLDLTHRITFGFQTSYVDLDGDTVDTTVGDGKALFDNAHTLKQSGTTYRNTLTGNAAFSQSSLEAMENVRVSNCLDHFGAKKTMRANTIFTTDDQPTINAVKVLLYSRGNITSGLNSEVYNPYNTVGYKHVILPRLATDVYGNVDSTKSKYWGLAATDFTTAYLGIQEAPRMIEASAGANSENFSNDDWKFATRATYMIGIVTAPWITISKGDAS